MKRLLSILLVLLLIPLSAAAEELLEPDDDWEDDWGAWEPDDWREDWEERGFFAFCDVRDDTLIISEGVTALAKFTDDPDGEDESEKITGDRLCFERSFDPNFHRVSFPSTLRQIGSEAFVYYHFDTFTLPAQVERLEEYAFTYCSFDVLRVESDLPVEVLMGSLYDCTVASWEVPEDHPHLKSIDGVLFSKDGKTLIDYPNGRKDTHYDVPAGAERISNIHNDYLQTISLPIGLKVIDDAGFAGCTRLQAISLPLTVQKIGKHIFYECVSLELVSLPDGLEADKDADGRWAEYYPDDALYRGDNGDTLAGAKSQGRIGAPGRLFSLDAKETYVYSAGGAQKQRLIPVYNTADAANSYRWYRQGKTVYMGTYENGRAALYEPLGGTYTAAVGYGSILGWVRITDVKYLSPQTLFEYAEVKPRSPMPVWWNHLPDYEYWTPWETVIPLDGRTYKPTLFGAFVRFEDPVTHAVFGCAIQDAELTRVPDGTDQVYGIVFNPAFLEDIPLRAAPGGAAFKKLSGGTQVRILAEDGRWVQVSDGADIGWVEQDHVRVVPEKQEEEKE